MDQLEIIDSVEALSWLLKADGKERDIREDPETMLDLAASLRIVQQLYAAGAVEVRAINVAIGDDFEFGQGIEVLLPQDRVKQEAIYAVGVRALQEMEWPWDDVDRNGESFVIKW